MTNVSVYAAQEGAQANQCAVAGTQYAGGGLVVPMGGTLDAPGGYARTNFIRVTDTIEGQTYTWKIWQVPPTIHPQLIRILNDNAEASAGTLRSNLNDFELVVTKNAGVINIGAK
ncbi:hypothetical protein QUA30_15450 [Microcoleus sp. Pol14C2]|uniref:hypothetical protein n=1 Tax=unclassified Microcoleus TaxID=2642155 RepID=UPI002FD3F10B